MQSGPTSSTSVGRFWKKLFVQRRGPALDLQVCAFLQIFGHPRVGTFRQNFEQRHPYPLPPHKILERAGGGRRWKFHGVLVSVFQFPVLYNSNILRSRGIGRKSKISMGIGPCSSPCSTVFRNVQEHVLQMGMPGRGMS